MTFPRILSLGLVAASTVLLAAGCSAPATDDAASDPVTIAVVTPHGTEATNVNRIDTLQKAADERGWELTVTDTSADYAKFNSVLQDLAVQKPDIIVDLSGNASQLTLGLQATKDAGIPVVGIGTGPSDLLDAYLLADEEGIGRDSAQLLTEAIGGSGGVLVLDHPTDVSTRAYREAAVEYFEENGITVLGVQSIASPAHVENARAAVQDAITSYGAELSGVWGGWDEVALGATQALEAAGVEGVPVTGIGGLDFALAEIAKGGPFYGTIPYDVAGTDAKLLEILDAWVNDGELPADPAIVIPPGAPIVQK